MTTETINLRGCPVEVDYIEHPRGRRVRVRFNCGSYTDELVFVFANEADCAHSFMMWQELIVTAEAYQRENS